MDLNSHIPLIGNANATVCFRKVFIFPIDMQSWLSISSCLCRRLGESVSLRKLHRQLVARSPSATGCICRSQKRRRPTGCAGASERRIQAILMACSRLQLQSTWKKANEAGRCTTHQEACFWKLLAMHESVIRGSFNPRVPDRVPGLSCLSK